jgi:hypothetical protein
MKFAASISNRKSPVDRLVFMHHMRFCHGLMSFFQRLPHRLSWLYDSAKPSSTTLSANNFFGPCIVFTSLVTKSDHLFSCCKITIADFH